MIMSDEELDAEYEEEHIEHEAEEAPKQEKPKHRPPPKHQETIEKKSEAEEIMLAQKRKHEEEEALKMKEYEEQRRIQREREEEELRQLKEKQERRRLERDEEERIMAEKRREQEEKRRQEEEERKQKQEDEKKRKDEEKRKKAAMMAGLKSSGVQLDIPRKSTTEEKFSTFANIVKAKSEMGLTKDQHEEQKKRYLQEAVKGLNAENMELGALRSKLKEMHKRICKLEASRYDLDRRKERQEYDLKELNERQRQITRNKALKKGIDPDAAVSSRHPPKLPISSKYDRQIDRRSYGDRRILFESDKTPKERKVFHGSSRPPNTWGRRENEELEQIRKNLEPPKYVETVKIENARPPVVYVPAAVPEDEIEDE